VAPGADVAVTEAALPEPVIPAAASQETAEEAARAASAHSEDRALSAKLTAEAAAAPSPEFPAPGEVAEAEPIPDPPEDQISRPEDAPVVYGPPGPEEGVRAVKEEAERAPAAEKPAAPGVEGARAGAPETPAPAGEPGERADKEAIATSIKQAVEYRNGRVLAGQGLDIRTVRPEFSTYTQLTALPRIPVVEITFDTAGRVKNVRLIQSSGYKDVDEPILNAVWAWTAKGKQLEMLARDNPRALLKISVRMLL
jgi:TonB family protein